MALLVKQASKINQDQKRGLVAYVRWVESMIQILRSWDDKQS
jgi:hypothetical protein